jgi:hypothetical protein
MLSLLLSSPFLPFLSHTHSLSLTLFFLSLILSLLLPSNVSFFLSLSHTLSCCLSYSLSFSSLIHTLSFYLFPLFFLSFPTNLSSHSHTHLTFINTLFGFFSVLTPLTCFIHCVLTFTQLTQPNFLLFNFQKIISLTLIVLLYRPVVSNHIISFV